MSATRPAEEDAGNGDQAIDMAKAMRRAYHLGQTYWQQADSESLSQQRKSDETQAKFDRLLTETVAALAAPGAAVAGHDAERMDRIRKAINGYHLALDTRQHGGVAMDRAFNIIADAMGMPWVPGAAARAVPPSGGAHG